MNSEPKQSGTAKDSADAAPAAAEKSASTPDRRHWSQSVDLLALAKADGERERQEKRERRERKRR